MAKLGTTGSGSKKKKIGIPAPTPTQTAIAKRGNINQFPQGLDQAPNEEARAAEIERRRSFEQQMKPQITAFNNQPINNEQFRQVMEAKKSRGKILPQDTNAAQIFSKNQQDLLTQRMAQEDIAAKKKAAIEATINPQAKPQPTGINLNPQVQAQEIPGILEQTGTAALKGALTGAGSGAAVGGGLAGVPTGGVLAIPGAAIGATLGAVTGLISGAIIGGFSAAKENKKDFLNQAGSLGVDAESGMAKTIQQAAQGMDEVQAIINFQQDVVYLRQAEANMQQLIKQDESYYNKKGRDEMVQIQTAISRLNFYEQKLAEAIANNKNRIMTDLSMLPQQAPTFNPAQND
jgi:hypothetical protein